MRLNIRNLKASAMTLLAASGLFSAEASVAMTAAVAQVTASVTTPAVAEERTFLDGVERLKRIGIEPEGVVNGSTFRVLLSGLEIASVRILASRTTLPSLRRYWKWRQAVPHFGNNQASKLIARLRRERAAMRGLAA